MEMMDKINQLPHLLRYSSFLCFTESFITAEDHSILESMLSFLLQLVVNLFLPEIQISPPSNAAPVLCPSCGCRGSSVVFVLFYAHVRAGEHVSRGARGNALSTFVKSSVCWC